MWLLQAWNIKRATCKRPQRTIYHVTYVVSLMGSVYAIASTLHSLTSDKSVIPQCSYREFVTPRTYHKLQEFQNLSYTTWNRVWLKAVSRVVVFILILSIHYPVCQSGMCTVHNLICQRWNSKCNSLSCVKNPSVGIFNGIFNQSPSPAPYIEEFKKKVKSE